MLDPYIPGARMAVIQHGLVVGVRTIEKVYTNGNFILKLLPGSPTDRRPQWRPSREIATQCGGHFRVGAMHLEPWTVEHARRLAAHHVSQDSDRRLEKIIACLRDRKDLTREVLAAMESALGIPVGAANE